MQWKGQLLHRHCMPLAASCHSKHGTESQTTNGSDDQQCHDVPTREIRALQMHPFICSAPALTWHIHALGLPHQHLYFSWTTACISPTLNHAHGQHQADNAEVS